MKKSILALSVLSMTSLLSARSGDDAASLNMSYTTLDEVPEAFRPLYSESEGKFNLTGVVGIKTQEDINRLTTALGKEREDHRLAKGVISKLGGREIDEILTDLDSIPALKAAAAGTNIEEQLKGRLSQETAPLQRNISELTAQLAESQDLITGYKQKETRNTINASVNKAALAGKALPEAVEDISFMANAIFEVNESGAVVAKDGIPGVTPGIAPEVWLTELKRSKPFYFPVSNGAGGKGGKGQSGAANPFSKDNWNMTEQGAMVRANPTLAKQMAESAGTSIGGRKPV